MKIVFLNLWEATCAQELQAFLREHIPDTDIFCLQEVEGPAQELCRRVFSADFVSTEARKPAEVENEWFRQATVIRSTLAVESSVSMFEDVAAPGVGLYTHVRVRGQSLHIVNIHGIPHPGKLDSPERLVQSRAILDFLKEKKGVHIIGGDFNLMPETESMKLFEEAGYENLIRTFDIKTTRNRFAWERYPDSPLMYSDYVLVRGSVHVRSFEVPPLEISDHLPMILNIEI